MPDRFHQSRGPRRLFVAATTFCLWICGARWAAAQEQGSSGPAQPEFQDLLEAGGTVGIIILVLSVAMVALIVEHLLTIRRRALMPGGLAEEVHRCLSGGNFQQADQQCRMNPSLLGHVLSAGIAEVNLGYAAIEKAMEDSSREQAARLFRKIEYLSVIGTIAPMLGLLGTVWGMINAFFEFEKTPNPQVAELAPGIYKALVTTLLGLSVAVPALASFAIFRNRIDQLVAEATLLAEHVFADFKRQAAARRKAARRGGKPGGAEQQSSGGVSAMAMEREGNE